MTTLPTNLGPGSRITTKTGLKGTVFFVCREAPGDGREPFVRMRSDKTHGGIHDVPASTIRKVAPPAPPMWVNDGDGGSRPSTEEERAAFAAAHGGV